VPVPIIEHSRACCRVHSTSRRVSATDDVLYRLGKT